MKKVISLICVTALAGALFTGCGGGGDTGFDTTADISVITREDGSGTRGAFIELFGIEEKDSSGNKKDMTTKEADVAMKTDIMLTSVANNPYAIGYVSMGYLSDSVKAVKIDGVEPKTENVVNGTYKIARPFNIATKGEPEGLAKDFIDFILSEDGQEVVGESYIKISGPLSPYAGSKPSGKITVSGSSSVTPIMEKLKEAYIQVNPNAEIEVQQTDSTSGMTAAANGTCDIGMASRDLKDSEKETLKDTVIAIDGIAVIANKQNTIDGLTSEQVKSIFTGKTLSWDEVIK